MHDINVNKNKIIVITESSRKTGLQQKEHTLETLDKRIWGKNNYF